MLKWLKKTALWIIALPLLATYLGAGLNQIVLYANHDRFPVRVNDARLFEYKQKLRHELESCSVGYGEESQYQSSCVEEVQIRAEELEHGFLDDVHVIANADTRLNWLADWIDLHGDIYSPGDVLLYLGDAGMEYAPLVWVIVAISKLNKREREEY